jgi:hypothetical protein
MKRKNKGITHPIPTLEDVNHIDTKTIKLKTAISIHTVFVKAIIASTCKNGKEETNIVNLQNTPLLV